MKTKNINGKIFLRKQTISNLSNVELGAARGGTADTGSGCTYCVECKTHGPTFCIMTYTTCPLTR